MDDDDDGTIPKRTCRIRYNGFGVLTVLFVPNWHKLSSACLSNGGEHWRICTWWSRDTLISHVPNGSTAKSSISFACAVNDVNKFNWIKRSDDDEAGQIIS